VRRHVPVIHDLAPLTLPEFFSHAYRALARTLTGPLVRRSALVVTPSTHVRGELLDRFELEENQVQVVPPGVGEPFVSVSLDDLERRKGGYCVLVGAHASRKNAKFLVELWPEIRSRTGLELHLTYRRIVTTRRPRGLEGVPPDGVVLHADPTDNELAQLYTNALCLLWPSHYEGYGFPLLEAMAVGTPFLSTDVGAAAELAVRPQEQILPLEPERWLARLEEWRSVDLVELRRASAQRARAQSWDAAAGQTAQILDGLSQSG
jgi:Glycosyl transferases group 1